MTTGVQKCLLLVVLMRSLTASPSIGNNTGILCISQNPLIRMLKNNSVEVYDVPRETNAATCAREWHYHQTCCNPQHIVDYAKQDLQHIKKAIVNMREDVEIMFAFEREISEFVQQRTLNGNSYYIDLQKDLNKFKRLFKDLLAFDSAPSTDKDKDACFNRIHEIRTNSLCYTCSGRSSHFFLQGLALMSMSECLTTLQKCIHTWRSTVILIDVLVVAATMKAKFRRMMNHILSKINLELGHIQNLQVWIGGDQIRSALQDYSKNPKTTSWVSKKLICESFISLRKSDLIKEVSEKLLTATNSSSVINKTAPTTGNTPNWKVGNNRLLGSSGPLQLLQPVDLNTPSIQVVRNENCQTENSHKQCGEYTVDVYGDKETPKISPVAPVEPSAQVDTRKTNTSKTDQTNPKLRVEPPASVSSSRSSIVGRSNPTHPETPSSGNIERVFGGLLLVNFLLTFAV